jgi:uncharacterized protein
MKEPGPSPPRFSADCDVPVSSLSMRQWWQQLTFVHWNYDPAVVQRLLPPSLRVETFDGRAWVGLVPFFMRVAPLRLPAAPPLFRFPETNVRTYVTAADGTTGVWFFSLDATRLFAVATGRTLWRLPYCWSSMRVRRDGDVMTYGCRRRWPARVRSEQRIRIGAVRGHATSDLEHWLTARWQLFAATRRGCLRGRVEHSRWPLHDAEWLGGDANLLAAAGLPEPTTRPLVHWADAVVVRVGWPARVGTRRD